MNHHADAAATINMWSKHQVNVWLEDGSVAAACEAALQGLLQTVDLLPGRCAPRGRAVQAL